MTQAQEGLAQLRRGIPLEVVTQSCKRTRFAGVVSWFFPDSSRLWRKDGRRDVIHSAPGNSR